MIEEKSKPVVLKLTSEQTNLVLEALLYAGSINIGANWDDEACERIIQTATHIKKQFGADNVNFNNLTYFEDEGFKDALTDKINESFNIEHFTVKSLNAV